MSTDAPTPQKTALEFKSTSLNVPALVVISDQVIHFENQLKEKVAQAPEFFKHSPVLIDLQEINKKGLKIDLQKFIDVLTGHDFFPVGIRGGNDEQNQLAIQLKLPTHSIHSTTPPSSVNTHPKTISPSPQHTEVTEAEEGDTPLQHSIENKLITVPVRSGQRIYAKGDLIITAAVSAGAEIYAEGNIHIYGALRGRAYAGVQGDELCRIFCSDLHAELIAIAGNYKLSDQLDNSTKNKPVQISLQDQALIIQPI